MTRPVAPRSAICLSCRIGVGGRQWQPQRSFSCTYRRRRPDQEPETTTTTTTTTPTPTPTPTKTTTPTTATPSIAPRASLNLKHIRTQPELHSANCQARHVHHHIDTPFEIARLHQSWQKLQDEAKTLQAQSHQLTRQLAPFVLGPFAPGVRNQRLREARDVKQQLARLTAAASPLKARIDHLALQLPNLTSAETPAGAEPRVVGYLNDGETISTAPSSSQGRRWKSHVELGADFGLMDFAAAATTTGWGWYFLTNEAALLEQALVQYALQTVVGRGAAWTAVAPPSIVYGHVAAGCGFRPRDQHGEQQIYTIHQPAPGTEAGGGSKPELCLAGTAEIPLAGMLANRVLAASDLPRKLVGASRCYRAEAGARGADTKGLYRVHEFTKVEMLAWTAPDEPATTAVFDEMVNIQANLLTALRLPCRILEMAAPELGASAARKRDIEVWFPSRRAHPTRGWGEVTSASVCLDYQTRRLATRVRLRPAGAAAAPGPAPGPAPGSTMAWPYTVNGTAMAVPRVLAALLEHGWDPERDEVRIPAVLWPWMAGRRVISRRRPTTEKEKEKEKEKETETRSGRERRRPVP
ncbi:MAG: Serine--tRNA ligase, mitochondrial [Phylliscum demangeonii]|nr:MAG: Serine--tRNA ligase, mitochondrial [Phylliscum demangeonii]